MDDFKEKLKMLAKETDIHRENRQKMFEKYESLVDSNRATEGKIADLQHYADELRKQIEEREDLYHERNREYVAKDGEVDANERACRIFEQKNLVLVEEISKQSAQLEAVGSRCSEIIDKLDETEGMLREKQRHLDELENRITEGDGKKRQLQSQLDSESQESLRSRKRLSSRSDSEYDATIESISEQVKNEEQRADMLEGLQKELSDKIEMLKDEIEAEQTSYKTLSTEIDGLLKGLASL